MFTIRFLGFMTHARVRHPKLQRDYQRVVIYDVPIDGYSHIPMLHVWKKDLYDADPPPPNDPEPMVKYHLRGPNDDLLTRVYTNLPGSGLPHVMLNGIPHMQGADGVSDGKDPLDEIACFEPTNALPVLVDLKDGVMAIENWFNRCASFGDKIKTTCVPKTTVFMAPTNGKKHVTIFIEPYPRGKKLKVRLRPDSNVYITNMADDAMDHFNYLTAFFKNGASVTVHGPKKRKHKCPFGQRRRRGGEIGYNLGVECSHTQFP